MDLSSVQALPPETIRSFLPRFLAEYITDPAANTAATENISNLTKSWSDSEIVQLMDSLGSVGENQHLYLAEPLARDLSRAWSNTLLSSVDVIGLEHVRTAVQAGPTVLLCNHTSYMDSSVIDTLLADHGANDVANSVVSAAGPKVYSTLFRRFAAMCLNTLPVPQSTSLGHTARLSPRELARMALKSVKQAHETLQEGHVLLIFPEGSRTRTGRLQPFLQAVYRYIALDGLHVIPTALVGCGQIMDLESEKCVPGPVTLSFGKPIVVESRRDAQDVLNQAHLALSSLLPEEMRPE
jgi:1-acyl-sn-glycerol-3-phosphate acyltransferase